MKNLRIKQEDWETEPTFEIKFSIEDFKFFKRIYENCDEQVNYFVVSSNGDHKVVMKSIVLSDSSECPIDTE